MTLGSCHTFEAFNSFVFHISLENAICDSFYKMAGSVYNFTNVGIKGKHCFHSEGLQWKGLLLQSAD